MLAQFSGILEEGDTNTANMSSQSNSKKGDRKSSSQSSLTYSGTAASLDTSTNFGIGLQKDTKERKKCNSYTEDTPIDWDGLVEDVMKVEVDNIAKDLQGRKSNEK